MKILLVLLFSVLLYTGCDMPKFQLPLFDQHKVDSVYAKYEEYLGMESLTWSVILSYSSDTTAVRKLAFTVLNCSRITPDSDTLQYIVAAHIAQDFYSILQNKNNYNEVTVSFKWEKGFIFTMNYAYTYTFPATLLERGIALYPGTHTTTATMGALPADSAAGEAGGTSALIAVPAEIDSVPANRAEETSTTEVRPATSATSSSRSRY